MDKKWSINNIALIILVVLLAGVLVYFVLIKNLTSPESFAVSPTPAPLPSSVQCKDKPEGQPVITSILPISGPVVTQLEIKGCNFSGFEGDKFAWIENSQGTKGLLGGSPDATNDLIRPVLKTPLCREDNSYSGKECGVWLSLTPGVYKIYVMPWGKKSNEVDFTLK